MTLFAAYGLFEDDGLSEKYKDGNYNITKVISIDSGGSTTIPIAADESAFRV
ncbi:DUF5110 domain-containing protein [Rufibacter tibetensis]|uniref:DUF5110 domain-containing protein n=1 Tax=Rufibacter tibetensis TaxID=512763 RepID=UPI0009F8538B|nr:DUF5110 domain-containing protein [Rufibacter tibetensis]